MSDTDLNGKEPPLLNENATLADLKAKKERQRAVVSSAQVSHAPPDSQKTAAASDPVTARAKVSRPDRAGKVMIAGYFPAAISKALKHIAIDEGMSLQDVMADAFTLYLKAKLKRQ